MRTKTKFLSNCAQAPIFQVAGANGSE